MSRKNRRQRIASWLSIFNLAVAFVFLLFLFSVRPMRLNDGLMKDAERAAQFQPTPGAEKLIEAEHRKAIDEIKTRIEQEDSWFHYKFLLLGGLIAFLLGKVEFRNSKSSGAREKLAGGALFAIPHTIIAVACVIALAIDIHIRNNIVVVQQLALWIANFVEPVLLQRPPSQQLASGFVPWEQFLRIETAGEGMHRDDWYGFAFYPHLHILTWLIYMLYLWVSHKTYYHFLRCARQRARLSIALRHELKTWEQTGFPVFVLVHVALGAFTWVAHAAPSAFVFKLFPWSSTWSDGHTSGTIYLAIWACLVIVNLAVLYVLRRIVRA